MKPREFFISEDVDGYIATSAEDKTCQPFGFQFHVIEKSAYDEAVKNWAQMQTAVMNCEAKLKIAVEALKFANQKGLFPAGHRAVVKDALDKIEPVQKTGEK